MRRARGALQMSAQPAAEAVLAVGILSAHTVPLLIDRLWMSGCDGGGLAAVQGGCDRTVGALVLGIATVGAQAQGDDDLAALRDQVSQLYTKASTRGPFRLLSATSLLPASAR